MQVKVPIEVDARDRSAIGRELGTAKAAAEEGVRFWGQGILRNALRALVSGEVLEEAPANGPAGPVVGWRPFDYDAKAAAAPETDVLVWIVEEDYAEGVTVGYFDGFTFRTWQGSDDCSVSHWAPLAYPAAPAKESSDG